MTPEAMITRCPHCGNVTPHRVLSKVGDVVYPEDELWDDHHYFDWYFLLCGTCEKKSLLTAEEEFENPEILYPPSQKLEESVPESVAHEYSEALLVRQISPSSFAVHIRRALEAICQERNVSERTLSQSWVKLAAESEMPPLLQEISGVARILGNRGAHYGEKVTEEDAKILNEFFLAIVEYLFIAPSKLSRYRESLQALGSNPHQNSP